jgi:hopanoid-associated phosphorylase
VTLIVACGLKREIRELGPGIRAIAGGGVPAALEAALETQIAGASMIVSAGIAGALSPDLRVGDIVIGDHVIGHGDTDSRLRAMLASALPESRTGGILGSDHIWASSSDKATMFHGTRALAADMESHVAARVAQRHGLPFAVVRAISDSASDELPPAALVGMKPDGSMAIGRVVWALTKRPAQLPALLRTGRHAEAAFRQLPRIGDALRLCTA